MGSLNKLMIQFLSAKIFQFLIVETSSGMYMYFLVNWGVYYMYILIVWYL